MSPRYLTALFLALGLLCGGRATAQRLAQVQVRQRYWDAHLDSLRRILATQHTDTARLRTLRHLLDVINPSRLQFTLSFAAEAAALSTRLHRPEARAYHLLAACTRLRETNLSAGLDSMRAAIAAMDELHHPVPMWLTGTRILYDDLERQEARRAFFDAKRAYYQQRGDTLSLAACYYALANYYSYRGDLNRAIGCFLRAADLYRPFKLAGYYGALGAAGVAYAEWGNQTRALHYLRQAQTAPPALAGEPGGLDRAIAQIYLRQRDYPAAWQALVRSMRQNKASAHADSVGAHRFHIFNLVFSLTLQGEVLVAQHRAAEAGPLLRRAQYLADSIHMPLTSVVGNLELDATWAKYYLARGATARAEAAWQAAYRKARLRHSAPLRLVYLRELARFYQARGQHGPAATYALAAALLADTLETAQGAFHLANYEAEQADRAQQARIAGLRQAQQREEARARRQRRVLMAVVGGASLLLGLAAVLYYAFRRSEHLKRLVTAQKQDLQIQRDQLDASLTDLRRTQAQLIQKEKMASLGELTAGIAHEIQNPLNFVNNFSEVSAELVKEIQAALAASDSAEAAALAGDVAQNLSKITEHGKRAANIVRGMLEHSRASTGERAPTDINQLADEYLRLAYHGLRAKDKTFNAQFATDFAPGLPLIEAVSQDLGRVLLNLFNNAFYAVQQRQLSGEAGYAPTVRVQTEQVGKQVHIRVSDNGVGMPAEVQAKVFQPFFTTKPTGEGTGLGLSLSHDIIAQGHSGTLTVESQEGVGTTFTITLPAA